MQPPRQSMKATSLLKSYRTEDSLFQEAALRTIEIFESFDHLDSRINLEKTNLDRESNWVTHTEENLPDVHAILKSSFSSHQEVDQFEKDEEALPLIFAFWETGIEIGERRYLLTPYGREIFPAIFVLVLLGEDQETFTDESKLVANASALSRQEILDTPVGHFSKKIKALLNKSLGIQISRYHRNAHFNSLMESAFVRYHQNQVPEVKTYKTYEAFISCAPLKQVADFFIFLKDHDLYFTGNLYLETFLDLFNVRTFIYKMKEGLLLFEGNEFKVTDNNASILKALLNGPISPQQYQSVLPTHSQADKPFNDFKAFCQTKLGFNPHIKNIGYRIPNDVEFIIDSSPLKS